MNTLHRIYRQVPWEAVVWTVALITLAFYNPSHDQHLSLCPLHSMGFSFCPGCGLGRSVAYIFQGEWGQSMQSHPLGFMAIIVLVYRIVSLTLIHRKLYGKNT